MRAIDADAALARLAMFSDRENGNEHFFNGIDTAKEILDSTPTIEPTANWTPCSVGLPENADDVLIYFDRCGGEVGIGYYGERADGVRLWCVMGSMLCYNVLAWQPLPEPYRGGE